MRERQEAEIEARFGPAPVAPVSRPSIRVSELDRITERVIPQAPQRRFEVPQEMVGQRVAPTLPFSRMADLGLETAFAKPGPIRPTRPWAGILGEIGQTVQPFTQSLLPESALGAIEQVPIAGSTLRHTAEFATSPLGIASIAAPPLRTFTLAGLGGQATLGTAGGALEEAGVGSIETPIGNIGPRTIGEVVGSLAWPGLMTAPGRAAARAVGRGAGRYAAEAAEAATAGVRATVEPFGLRRVEPVAAGREIPPSPLKRPSAEGMYLTNDIPLRQTIDQRLAEIDETLPRARGKLKASLTEERATLRAQRDIDDIRNSGRPVEEQMAQVNTELEELQLEGRIRSVPFRGRYATGTMERAPQFGPEFKEWQAGRTPRRLAVEAQKRATAQRFPDLTTPELNARERIFREFMDNAKIEPAPAAPRIEAEPVVGRRDLFGEERSTFATEAELQGYRATQGRLGIGAGERPVETAGPLFERGAHRPMTVEGGAARLDDLSPAFGEDIYGENAIRYFGTGDDSIDAQTLAILKPLRGRPDAEVTVFRSVPSDVPMGKLSEGDWVTVNRRYAEQHGEAALGGKYRIDQQRVRAKDLTTNADSFHEQGYYPLERGAAEAPPREQAIAALEKAYADSEAARNQAYADFKAGRATEAPPPPREPPTATAGGMPPREPPVPPPREPPPPTAAREIPPGEPPIKPPVVETPAEPPASIRNRYVAPLREFADVEKEVVTSDNPIVRAAIGRTGIDPSILEGSPEGRALTAYFRQRSSADELTQVAVGAAYDAPAQGFTGLRRVRIGADARVKNVTIPPGKSDVWYDVFSHYRDYPLTAAQRTEVEGFLQVVRETEQMRVAAGLKPRTIQQALEDVFYVPRQVKGIRGLELRRPSRPELQRHYEAAQEGIAAGVKYDSSPRDVLELHLRAAYREVVDKQLDDALEPLSITAKQLVPEPVRIRMENAVKERLAAERGRRALTVSRATEAVAPAEAKTLRGRSVRRPPPEKGFEFIPGKVTSAQRAADVRLAAARREYAYAKNTYGRAMEAARKAEVAPGSLFGRSEEAIAIGSWRNRFLPRDQADHLRETLGTFLRSPEHANAVSRGIELIGNYTRFLASVGDFAEPFIQGLPLLVRNPVAWSRATARHYQAFFDPGVQARYIRDHLETFQWMARNNIPIGDVEFFSAITRGGGISAVGEAVAKLPGGEGARAFARGVGKQTFGRFQQSYNTGLGVGRAQLVEAIKPTWKGTDADLATYIRNMTGGLDTKALGVGPNQRAVESMWLAFSPRLLRSTLALGADLRLNPLTNPRGREAWRMLATLVAGATGIYVLTGKALGKSDDEILNGLNPLNGKRFLSHEVNGDWIGIGGQARAITQLLAATASAAAPGGRPIEDLVSKDMWDNPLLAFYSSRGAPAMNIVGGTIEAITGLNALQFENISGIPDLLKHIGTSALPFALQGVLEGQNLLTSGAGMLGARTSAETLSERRNAITQERWGKDYYDLDLSLRRLADADAEVQKLSQQIDESQRQRGDKYQLAQDEIDRQSAPLRQEQLKDDAAAQSGATPIEDWKEATSRRQMSLAQIRASVYGAQGITFEERERQPLETVLDRYYSIDAETYRDPITRLVDWDRFFAERDRVLASLSPADRATIQTEIEKNLSPFQKQYKEAQQVLDDLPSKYKGLTAEQARNVDRFVFDEVPQMAGEYALEIGHKISQKVAAQALAQQKGDPALYEWYLALRNQKQREELLNDAYYDFLRSNQGLLETFYPFYYDTQGELERLGLIEEAPEFGRPKRPERPKRPTRMTREEWAEAEQDKRDLEAILR